MKDRKNLTLNQETIEYIESYNKIHGINSISSGIDKIIMEHKLNGEDTTDLLVAAFEKKYGDVFSKMKRGINSTDGNIQVAIELLNTLIITLEATKYYPSLLYESPPLKEARDTVSKKAAYGKQVADSKRIRGGK